MALNKAMLIGNLGADPELKYTQGGQAVLRMRLAVGERWKDKNGEKQERTEWFTIIMWGKRGEALANHLTKGQSVYIEGRIQTRQWEDTDGNTPSTTEVVANELQFLGGGKREGGGERRQERAAPQNDKYGAPTDGFPEDDFGDDDSIPF